MPDRPTKLLMIGLDGFMMESIRDVAPTVCHLLGLDPPGASEGRIVTEFLAEAEIPL